MPWYYSPPQPTQLVPKLVQASTGQAPPIKAAAATAAAILSLWPFSHDPSAGYIHNSRPRQTAPLTLAYGQQPPPTSQSAFYGVRATWLDTTWSYQQAQLEASTVARVDNPPLVIASPVIVKDPSRPIYGLSWQYGTQTARGDFSGVWTSAPPPVGGAAALPDASASWLPTTWSAQQAVPVAAIVPFVPPVNNPPPLLATPVVIKDPARPIYGLCWQYGVQTARGDFSGFSTIPSSTAPPIGGGASIPDAFASWLPITWSAQTLSGPIVQPYPGDEPPGVSMSSPDLAAFGYYDGWPAQRLSFAATVVTPPIVSPYLPPNAFPYPALTAWQVAPTWNAQRLSFIATLIPPPIVSSHVAPNVFPYTALVGWQLAPTWPAQTEPPVATFAPLPVGSQPPPSNFQQFYSLRATWSDPTWPTQTVYTLLQPGVTIVYNPKGAILLMLNDYGPRLVL